MKIREIYQLFIELGIDNDPRSKNEIERELARAAEEYQDLKAEEKAYFDKDRLENPYADTRILAGDPDSEVKTVLAGIDLETPEILLAETIRQRGDKVDLLLSHHPEGRALAGLFRVMHMQEDILAKMGIPITVAEGILTSRISEVERGLLPLNQNRAVDAARLLGYPFMCVHTPADNMVNSYLEKFCTDRQPYTLGDVVKALREIPEYHEAARLGTGPKIVIGSNKRRAGRIMVDMTGGTGGSKDAYAKLSAAGIGTVITMHTSEAHRKEAEKNHVNIIIAGHMASDSLGMNLLLDQLEQRGLAILPCSGLLRVSRNN